MNQCIWLKRNSLETCGRKCYNSYCLAHINRTPLSPCSKCGHGTKSKTHLCVNCGQQSALGCQWNRERLKKIKDEQKSELENELQKYKNLCIALGIEIKNSTGLEK